LLIAYDKLVWLGPYPLEVPVPLLQQRQAYPASNDERDTGNPYVVQTQSIHKGRKFASDGTHPGREVEKEKLTDRLKEVVVDTEGIVLWRGDYLFKRLSVPGQLIVHEGKHYRVVSCNRREDTVLMVLEPWEGQLLRKARRYLRILSGL